MNIKKRWGGEGLTNFENPFLIFMYYIEKYI